MITREISSDNYCIEEQHWLCEDCAHRFSEYAPSNYELVCFDGEDGVRYFLPVYGPHGYLELMRTLMPECDLRKPIRLNTAVEFLNRLHDITPIRLSAPQTSPRCPICGSEKTICEQRTVLHNYPVSWLPIDKNFLNNH